MSKEVRVVSVAVGLIVRDEDQHVLMTLRSPTGTRPNLWEFPGGKAFRKETIPVAVRRELEEELGVRAEVQKRLAGCVLHLEELFVIDLYVCRIIEGEPRPLVASALEWVDIDRAVVDRPLVPSCYLFYQSVRNHLQTVRETRL